jgi:hypothetical protein
MPIRISAIVRGLGQNYADGLEMLSVDVKKEGAAGLPFADGRRTQINLLVGTERYTAGLRTTSRMPTVWISPNLMDSRGKRTSLAKVLTAMGVKKNDLVTLEVQEERICLLLNQSVG